jgi:hypothetical protein
MTGTETPNTVETALPALAGPAGSASAQLEWLWKNCTIVYWPPDGGYPWEHNPDASKYARLIIEGKMPNACVSDESVDGPTAVQCDEILGRPHYF